MDNIIDYKPYMASEYKVYVSVFVYHDEDGSIKPLSFRWEDGNVYEIDRIVDIRPAASLKAGGAGLRYKVKVRGRETYMFLEDFKDGSRWFMERK